MKRLRRTWPSSESAIPDATALYMICDAVARRKELIYGRLYDNGQVCALGAFWRDNPSVTLNNTLIEEVAGYNDSRSEEHTSELQSRLHLVCRLLLEKKK